jgi:hypothetical protein
MMARVDWVDEGTLYTNCVHEGRRLTKTVEKTHSTAAGVRESCHGILGGWGQGGQKQRSFSFAHAQKGNQKKHKASEVGSFFFVWHTLAEQKKKGLQMEGRGAEAFCTKRTR